jgi:lysine 2,3-aminomutase
MKSTLRSAEALRKHGLVPNDRLSELERVAARYAVAVTPAMAELIDPADPNDPIARQFIPDTAELRLRAEEITDPTGDFAHTPVDGVVHRYPDRVLLKLTHICAAYCRFCFRREMIGPGRHAVLPPKILAAALEYIDAHQDIWEVILTGGDPLVLSPRRLRDLIRQLAKIDHVKVIRVHTRVPVLDPQRITRNLVETLRAKSAATFVVLHANHARELTPAARAACARLIDSGIPMLSQSVLLRGINDNAQTLADLMRSFVECRIKPYYLHHGDLAPGTAHLRTGIEQGQRLMRSLRGHISGLCQPTYVLDIPGGHGKSPIGPTYLEPAEPQGRYRVEDYTGQWHEYPPARRTVK